MTDKTTEKVENIIDNCCELCCAFIENDATKDQPREINAPKPPGFCRLNPPTVFIVPTQNHLSGQMVLSFQTSNPPVSPTGWCCKFSAVWCTTEDKIDEMLEAMLAIMPSDH